MLTLNAHVLTQFQKCKRIYGISLTHRLTKWHPKALLSACLRRAIFGLSSGLPVNTVSDIAVQYFLSASKEPGLDLPVGLDTYTLAMDYCAIIRNVLEHLSRVTLLKLFDTPPVKLSEDVQWSFLSHADESGVRHIWIFPDYIPKDVTEEIHGWDVFGDIAASKNPMTLHMVAIGDRNKSHQDSPWCRTYAHPHVANVFRFNKRSGSKLEGDWKPVYFGDNRKNKSCDWVDWMEKDETIDSLVKHIKIGEVSKEHRERFKSQVLYEAAHMLTMKGIDPQDLPMSREVCDKPSICRHQEYCYGPLSLDKIGLYTRLDKKSELVGV